MYAEAFLAISAMIYMYQAYLSASRKALERSVFDDTQTIAGKLKSGFSIESILSERAHNAGKTSSIFKEIISRLDKGEEIHEICLSISKRRKGDPAAHMLSMMAVASRYGKDLSSVFRQFHKDVKRAYLARDKMQKEVSTQRMLLLVVSSVLIPLTAVLLSYQFSLEVSYASRLYLVVQSFILCGASGLMTGKPYKGVASMLLGGSLTIMIIEYGLGGVLV